MSGRGHGVSTGSSVLSSSPNRPQFSLSPPHTGVKAISVPQNSISRMSSDFKTKLRIQTKTDTDEGKEKSEQQVLESPTTGPPSFPKIPPLFPTTPIPPLPSSNTPNNAMPLNAAMISDRLILSIVGEDPGLDVAQQVSLLKNSMRTRPETIKINPEIQTLDPPPNLDSITQDLRELEVDTLKVYEKDKSSFFGSMLPPITVQPNKNKFPDERVIEVPFKIFKFDTLSPDERIDKYLKGNWDPVIRNKIISKHRRYSWR